MQRQEGRGVAFLRILIKSILALAAVVAILIAVFAGYYQVRKRLYLVKRVEVVGCERSSAEDIVALSEITSSMSLLFIPLKKIKSRIETHPLVVVKEIKKEFPDTISIIIEERAPLIILKEGSRLYELSKEGYILNNGERLASFDLPILSDFPLDADKSKVGNVEVLSLLDLFADIRKNEPSLYHMISEIVYTKDELILYPKDLDFPTLIEHYFKKKKLKRLQGILSLQKQKGATNGFIDYRFTNPVGSIN